MFSRLKSRLLKCRRSPLDWYLADGAGLSDVIAAYQADDRLSITDSYLNLANSLTHPLTVGTIPGWDPIRGWIFNGVDTFLKTDINWADTTANGVGNVSVSVKYTALAADSPDYSALLGAEYYDTSWNGDMLTINPKFLGYYSVTSQYNWTRTSASVDVKGGGVLGFAGRVVYWNGIPLGDLFDDGFGLLTPSLPEIYIGCVHDFTEGVGHTNYSYLKGDIQKIAMYNKTLTAAQVMEISSKAALI